MTKVLTPTATNPVHILSTGELDALIPDESAAIAYMEKKRWGKDRHCVKCGCADRITPEARRPGTYWCGDCRSRLYRSHKPPWCMPSFPAE